MGSNSKKRTTMAKLNREQRLRERKAEKKAKKDARKRMPEQHEGLAMDTLNGDLPEVAQPDGEQLPVAPATVDV